MHQWWEQCHNTPDSYYISDYGGPALWERMKISRLIVQGAPILEIGVGGGTDIRELHGKGLEVHIVDIVPAAFDRVEGCFEKAWFESELQLLPENYFPCAISHLVTQHIDNNILVRQISHVVRALRPDGVFAMQFADGLPSISDDSYDESLTAQQIGSVHRTPQMVKSIVERCGGKVSWISRPEPYPEHRKQWYYVHIRKAKKRRWGHFFFRRRPQNPVS